LPWRSRLELTPCAKTYQRHVLARACRGHVCDSLKRNPLDAAMGRLYRHKILLLGDSRKKRSRLKCAAFPQFNLRVLPVAYAMEQNFLGRPPNSDTFLKGDVWASSRSEPVRGDGSKAEVAQCVQIVTQSALEAVPCGTGNLNCYLYIMM
jgi:hypothetical protein